MVSAWLVNSGLVLGQVKTSEKSNEIKAIPELLELLSLKDVVVTIDAMGCQRAIAEQITALGGHYVLAVKENQPTLHSDIVGFFEDSDRKTWPLDEKAPVVDEHRMVDADHGRIEQRICRMSRELSWMQSAQDWKGLVAIARIEAIREDAISGKSSREYRYYIVSKPDASAESLNSIIRNHWGIENGLHWVLDVTVGEDAARVRMGNAAENLSTLRKVVLNLLKSVPQQTRKKLSIPKKRKRCVWNHDYLASCLAFLTLK